jgi:hypothetical protein
VVQAHNPSYSGGKPRKFKTSLGKMLARPHLNQKIWVW